MLELRPMRPEDHDQAARLWTDVYVIRPPDKVHQWFREAVYPHLRVALVELVALDGTAIRGILGFLGRHDAQAKEVKLDMPSHWEPGLYIPDLISHRY